MALTMSAIQIVFMNNYSLSLYSLLGCCPSIAIALIMDYRLLEFFLDFFIFRYLMVDDIT